MCLFNTFSTDSGCTVELVSTIGQQQQYEEAFNKMDDDIASGNITGVDTGVYNIRAFDQGSNLVAVELLSAVTITGETSSTTSNIPTVTSTLTSTSTSISTNTFTSELLCVFIYCNHNHVFFFVAFIDSSITNMGVASDLTGNVIDNIVARDWKLLLLNYY